MFNYFFSRELKSFSRVLYFFIFFCLAVLFKARRSSDLFASVVSILICLIFGNFFLQLSYRKLFSEICSNEFVRDNTAKDSLPGNNLYGIAILRFNFRIKIDCPCGNRRMTLVIKDFASWIFLKTLTALIIEPKSDNFLIKIRAILFSVKYTLYEGCIFHGQ